MFRTTVVMTVALCLASSCATRGGVRRSDADEDGDEDEAAVMARLTSRPPRPEDAEYEAWLKRQSDESDRERERREKLSGKDVAKVVLAVDGNATTYCRGGSVAATFFDAKGQPLDFLDPSEVVDWESEPAGFIDARGAFQNPAVRTLEHLGAPLRLRAKVRGGGDASAEVTLTPSFECMRELALTAGERGTDGAEGRAGQGGDRRRVDGAPGGNGAPGRAGVGGAKVAVEAAFIRDAAGTRFLLVVVQQGDGETWSVFEKDAVVTFRGPAGGAGGAGGKGGRGFFGDEPCDRLGDGGEGGDGGPGGDGGAGPDVKVRVASSAVRERLSITSEGGEGGKPGAAGAGGAANHSFCGNTGKTVRGREGKAGRGGEGAGRAGRKGDVDVDVVPATQLKRLKALLSTAPQLKLDEGKR